MCCGPPEVYAVFPFCTQNTIVDRSLSRQLKLKNLLYPRACKHSDARLIGLYVKIARNQGRRSSRRLAHEHCRIKESIQRKTHEEHANIQTHTITQAEASREIRTADRPHRGRGVYLNLYDVSSQHASNMNMAERGCVRR